MALAAIVRDIAGETAELPVDTAWIIAALWEVQHAVIFAVRNVEPALAVEREAARKIHAVAAWPSDSALAIVVLHPNGEVVELSIDPTGLGVVGREVENPVVA